MRLMLYLILLSTYTISTNAFADDVKVEGIATEEYHLLGGWGWKVSVDKVISGPSTLTGTILSVGETSVPNSQRGWLDPDIAVGDRVEAYGDLYGQDFINLVGSNEYYLKKSQSS